MSQKDINRGALEKRISQKGVPKVVFFALYQMWKNSIRNIRLNINTNIKNFRGVT